MHRLLCVLALLPAVASAQDGKGPCPRSAGPDSALFGFVAKPDHKPRRKNDGIVPTFTDDAFTVYTTVDEDRNFTDGSMPRIVVLVGVVDTTGKIIPASTTITESSSTALAHAVCAAAVQMQFVPAMKGGHRVAALYKEQFAFHHSHTDINTPRGSRN